MQEAKFSSAMISVQGALGVMKSTSSTNLRPQITPFFDSKSGEGEVEYEIKQVIKQLEEETKRSGTHENVKVTLSEGKIHFRISNPMLFSSGNSNLRNTSLSTLDLVAKILKNSKYEIRVEGHTDNIPISTSRYPSNWELSTARAMSVVRYFIRQGVAAEKFQVIGYGQYRPIATNSTSIGRELNRRVEIYVNLKKESRGEIKQLINKSNVE
jgi:chemotaxis protein MotB